MREISDLIAWYENGVRFSCGCYADVLHPTVRRELLRGGLPITVLLRCPVHGQPAVQPPSFRDAQEDQSDEAGAKQITEEER